MNREMVFHRSLSWLGAARLALLLTLALLITNLGLPQAITGVLVNALLFGAVETVGVNGAALLGMITPFGAALRGILPLPLWVMIPFIALGNAALVNVYGLLRGKSRALALIAAAGAKFALLYAVVALLSARPLSLGMGNGAQVVHLSAALAQMMQWPQLATALGGGLLAQGVRLAASALRRNE
jgi:hypothetical protein